MKEIQLSNNLSIPVNDYANQGNSIIGIRGSGKTYTATKIAEQLMLNNIPIIAFDPTGVWQNLRYGLGDNKGFEIVVAGGFKPDIDLNEDNVTQIIDAALKEHVSLIIDLQGTATSNKSKWMRIVSESIQYLMAHNSEYGLRHVFLEEAAEFIPQRVMPGNGAITYSRIESMARIGRNYGLGYTLINQRAEEIAKAIFEISELVLVHRQAGKNSLKSIKDWLNYKGLSDTDIVQSLPKLINGECWAIDNNGETLINILPKDTFHPDPKKGNITAPIKGVADISDFINRMKNIISAPVEDLIKSNIKPSAKLIQLETENKDLKEINSELKNRNNHQADTIKILSDRLMKIFNLSNVDEVPAYSTSASQAQDKPIIRIELPIQESKTTEISKSNNGAMRMLKAIAMFHPKSITRNRVGTIAGISIKSSTFRGYLSTLKKSDYIIVSGDIISITELGLQNAGNVEPIPSDPQLLIQMWCNNIGNDSGAARMLRYLGEQYPKATTRANLGQNVSISPSSSTFRGYLSVLKKNGVISVNGDIVKASDELFN